MVLAATTDIFNDSTVTEEQILTYGFLFYVIILVLEKFIFL